jgi:cytochrome b involved in lipid metabolism
MGGGAESQKTQSEKKITLEELSKHREMDDAWVSMRGKVYDVSGWADHPGKFRYP